MKTNYHTDKECYYSTSILGRLWDMTDIDAEDLRNAAFTWADTSDYDPNFEYGNFRDHLGFWSTRLRKYNMETRSKKTKEDREAVLVAYKQMFTSKSLDEASAIYYANYEHSRKTYNGEHDPSFLFSLKIAGSELFEIYADNLTKHSSGAFGEPDVAAYPVRRRMLRPRRS